MSKNQIVKSYKNRTLNPTKPVEVYRNLNKKGVVYSVRQDGLVVGHTEKIYLVDAEFIVNQSGRKRAVKEQKRNVHAFIRGYARNSGSPSGFYSQFTYDPFKYTGFIDKQTEQVLDKADVVWIHGPLTYYCSTIDDYYRNTLLMSLVNGIFGSC